MINSVDVKFEPCASKWVSNFVKTPCSTRFVFKILIGIHSRKRDHYAGIVAYPHGAQSVCYSIELGVTFHEKCFIEQNNYFTLLSFKF